MNKRLLLLLRSRRCDLLLIYFLHSVCEVKDPRQRKVLIIVCEQHYSHFVYSNMPSNRLHKQIRDAQIIYS